MEKILHTVIAFLFFAVWYLYRRFKDLLSPRQDTSGCGGCGGCSDHTMHIPSKKPVQDDD